MKTLIASLVLATIASASFAATEEDKHYANLCFDRFVDIDKDINYSSNFKHGGIEAINFTLNGKTEYKDTIGIIMEKNTPWGTKEEVYEICLTRSYDYTVIPAIGSGAQVVEYFGLYNIPLYMK